MVGRVRLDPRKKLKSKAVALAQRPLTPLFGEPQLLEGEDAAAYNRLLSRFRAAVKPIDIIDEMFIDDAVTLEWEVLRARRLKFSLLRARGLEALEDFLRENLHYDLYRDRFVDDLTELLQQSVTGDQTKEARTLAEAYADNEPDAVEKVNSVLPDADWGEIEKSARASKAHELVIEYARGTSDAIALINELLAGAATGMDSLTVDALVRHLDYIERIEHLAVIAENRRNAALRELERRRAGLGETLRRTAQEIEDGEFEEIETAPDKRSIAA